MGPSRTSSDEDGALTDGISALETSLQRALLPLNSPWIPRDSASLHSPQSGQLLALLLSARLTRHMNLQPLLNKKEVYSLTRGD